MTTQPAIIIQHLFVSPGHNFFGHHGKPPGENPMVEVAEVRCVAGRGLEGDRFFDFKENYKGQITFFSGEIYDELCARFDVWDKAPSAFRRNVITRGIDLNTLVGREFTIQGIRFLGTAECTPCYWQDGAFAPGTEDALQGRGGLRAQILTDGVLRADANGAGS
jgi:MOSC domain-containing protein YiiM